MPANENPPIRGTSEDPLPRPVVQEDTIKTDHIQIERKTFVFSLKENPRGRFLRITEDVGGRRDTIIVPAPGLEEFKRMLDEVLKADAATPMKSSPRLSQP